jgi:hypothetical protein
MCQSGFTRSAAGGAGGTWLRACAVRASQRVPSFDRRVFRGGEGDPMVAAEMEAAEASAAAEAPEAALAATPGAAPAPAGGAARC